MKAKIVLSTLNAAYHHSAFGLRYLKANLGSLQSECKIKEYTIHKDPNEIAQEILSYNPSIIGFGVYIWNTIQTEKVIHSIRKLSPEVVIVLGGPEVSYETKDQEIVKPVDYVLCGEADFAFRELCESILVSNTRPSQKIIQSQQPLIQQLKLPYYLYSDDDVKNRTIYVEASRGCPYKCEYCLSSLDKSVRNFPLEQFLAEMESLYNRGLRQFKFIDRTFNLSPAISLKILQFFLDRIQDPNTDKNLFLHFEMVPDRLPDELKNLIRQFPAGSLQFEIGVQTWNESVAALVSRRQDYRKVEENLRFLKAETHVHTHVDLIGGLPGETLESFAIGFDRLAQLEPDEIQVGLLKRLKGTPIIRHDRQWEMNYSQISPFQILSTKTWSAEDIFKFTHFARFWDLIANRGQFKLTCQIIRKHCLENEISLFNFYWDLSGSLFESFGRSHGIHLNDLFKSLLSLLETKGFAAREVLLADYQRGERYYIPDFLKVQQDESAPLANELFSKTGIETKKRSISSKTPRRQAQHLL
jgi:radical SAM superfamily enzyme YgiQ (UPF0313 family)